MTQQRPASPVVGRRRLYNALRELREAAGLTLEEAAAAIEVSAATLSRLENGVRIPRARDVRDLCLRYDASPERTQELMTLVAAARESGWWEAYTEVDLDYGTYIGLEAAASRVQQYEGKLIPALLRTADYTRNFLQRVTNPVRLTPLSPHDIEKRIEVLARRQNLLSDAGFTYTAILDEECLRRPVGDAAVMAEQLDRLLTESGRPAVSIRIVPIGRGAHPGMSGSFIVLTLPGAISDVVYYESLAGQVVIDDDDALRRHRQIFTAIEAAALDQDESHAMIANIRDELLA